MFHDLRTDQTGQQSDDGQDHKEFYQREALGFELVTTMQLAHDYLAFRDRQRTRKLVLRTPDR
jgi:hypothetical protein